MEISLENLNLVIGALMVRDDYLNKVYLKPRFKKSLDLLISSSIGYFKKTNAFLVHA